RRHRKPSAVHQATDIAFESDVSELKLGCLNVLGILLLNISQSDDFGMAVKRIVVKIEFGVQRGEVSSLRDDHRINLDERTIFFYETPINTTEKLHGLF